MNSDGLYSFVMRAFLAEQALDGVGRKSPRAWSESQTQAIATSLSLELLDSEKIAKAKQMAVVYTAIAAFENSARELVSDVLADAKGENWWTECVSKSIRDRAESRREEEGKTRWHARRGGSPLTYTDFGDLISIMSQNWDLFEPHVRSLEWARQIISTLERSRNVIMHSGELDAADIDRIGIHIRDWVTQVGG